MEIVRLIYTEGLIDRDPKRLLDDFAVPEIEHVDPPEAVDPGIRRGRKEVMLALRRSRQSFPLYRHELHELFDAGDTVVAAVSGELGRVHPGAISLESWLGLAYLVVVGSLLGFTTYMWLLRAAPTSLVGTYAYVNPVVAVLLGTVLLGESLSWRTLVGWLANRARCRAA